MVLGISVLCKTVCVPEEGSGTTACGPGSQKATNGGVGTDLRPHIPLAKVDSDRTTEQSSSRIQDSYQDVYSTVRGLL